MTNEPTLPFWFKAYVDALTDNVLYGGEIVEAVRRDTDGHVVAVGIKNVRSMGQPFGILNAKAAEER